MADPLSVLQSFPEPRTTTNPYLVMLRRSLMNEPGVRVQTFTWPRALLGRHDVFHVHWPEILVSGRGPLRRGLRRALFALLLVRLKLRRTAVVRTAHNVRPHARVSKVERLLLGLLDRRTAMVVRLNEMTPVPDGTSSVTIPHGHYRDWFAADRAVPREHQRIAYVGLIRPYKGVDRLVRAFASTAERSPGARLEVAGHPSSAEVSEQVRAAAEGDARTSLTLAFVPDQELVEVVSRAELVALPYREMHNSGAALMALSLDRPVLVPDNAVTSLLAAEVGDQWVLRYDGELTGDVLLWALTCAADVPADARPDLSQRNWDRAGAEHVTAYRAAVAIARGRSVR